MKKILITFAIVLCIIPILSFAQTYEPLTPLPNTTVTCADGSGQCVDFQKYLPSVFTLLIGLAGVIAVVQIVIGGVLYLSTDAIQGKSDGKAKIQNALTGLLLVIASYIILNTINPATLNLNLTIQSYTPPTVTTASSTNPNTGGGNHCGTNNPCAAPNACSTGETCGADAACVKICYPPVVQCPGGTCSCPGCVVIGPTSTNVALKGFIIKPGSNNQLDGPFAIQLTGLLALLNSTPKVEWMITEAYLPTRRHQSVCHRQGTCVDADVTNPTTANVVAFYSLARSMGLRVVYETSSQAEANALIAAGIPAHQSGGSGVQVLPAGSGPGQISGNHFSVYK